MPLTKLEHELSPNSGLLSSNCVELSDKRAEHRSALFSRLEPILSYAAPGMSEPFTATPGYRASIYSLDRNVTHQATLLQISSLKAVVKTDYGLPIDSESPVIISINHSRTNAPLTLKGTVSCPEPSDNSGQHEISFSKSSRLNQRFIYFLANYFCQLAMRNPQDLSLHLCDSIESYEEAYGLVYKEYIARGYCCSKPDTLHYSYFNLLPKSNTFLLKRDSTLLGTISLVNDSACGLPIEASYPNEIAALRRQGSLAEVSLLALDSDLFARGKFSLLDCEKFVALFRLMNAIGSSAYARGISLVIAVHPKHELLYKWLGFEIVGNIKSYETAAGAPALPMYLQSNKRTINDASILIEHGPLDFLSTQLVPTEVLEDHGPLPALMFERLFRHVHSVVPERAMAYLRELYPTLCLENRSE